MSIGKLARMVEHSAELMLLKRLLRPPASATVSWGDASMYSSPPRVQMSWNVRGGGAGIILGCRLLQKGGTNSSARARNGAACVYRNSRVTSTVSLCPSLKGGDCNIHLRKHAWCSRRLALLQQSSSSAGEVATRGGVALPGMACRGVSRPSKLGRSDPESALPRSNGTSRSHALVGARSCWSICTGPLKSFGQSSPCKRYKPGDQKGASLDDMGWPLCSSRLPRRRDGTPLLKASLSVYTQQYPAMDSRQHLASLLPSTSYEIH